MTVPMTRDDRALLVIGAGVACLIAPASVCALLQYADSANIAHGAAAGLAFGIFLACIACPFLWLESRP